MEFYFELPKLRQRSFTAIGKVLEKNGFHQVKSIGPVERITLFGCLASAFRSPSIGPQFYLSGNLLRNVKLRVFPWKSPDVPGPP